MREILRLLLLFLIGLPLILVLAGPLLVVAALRGSQAVGPIVLNPGHNKPSGRVAALVIGLVVWAAVWGGTGLLLTRALPSPSPDTVVAGAPSSPTVPHPTPVVSPPQEPTAIPPSPSPTAPAPAPSNTPTQGTEPTALPVETEPAATQAADQTTPLPTPTPSPPPPTSPPTRPASAAEKADAIAAIEQANELLRLAVAQPTEDNLDALKTLWTETALQKAQEFAEEPSRIVGTPTEVSYAHLMPPSVESSVVPGHLTVSVTEVWTYTGSNDTYTESFEFFYTLAQQDGQWRILNYSYIDAPQYDAAFNAPSRYRPYQENVTP